MGSYSDADRSLGARKPGRREVGRRKSVGEGISEMRIHYGPGYRVYFYQSGIAVIVLLCGGNKATQAADIANAKAIAARWKESSHG